MPICALYASRVANELISQNFFPTIIEEETSITELLDHRLNSTSQIDDQCN